MLVGGNLPGTHDVGLGVDVTQQLWVQLYYASTTQFTGKMGKRVRG